MDQLTAKEQKLYELIKKGSKDSNALVARTGYSYSTIHQTVKRLIAKGLVTKVGASKATTYHAKEVSA